MFVAETAGHREALLDSLAKYGIKPQVVDNWAAFRAAGKSLCLVVAPMDHGLWLADPPLAIVTETQLSGEKVQQRRRRRSAAERNLEQNFRNLEELDIGAPVVHQDHGVGRYLGLTKLTVGGIETEFLALEYANNDKLYVPVSSLHLISRYSGASPESAPLHKLGGEQWQKAKRKALERVRDIAAELLNIYAKRAAKEGYAYKTFTEEYAAFAAGFPFEETPDQETAIVDVIKDMASPRPMDRVICGDVGFGKTEVAMRAAFIAAQNGKQVAVLVPTTLLAQQHYQNFRDRFADWPIRVEVVSRFVGKKQQEQLLEDLEKGAIDILIGTHKILQKDVRFKNLGLVIVDEEHRFGVAQKEHFKKLRSELDFLTLTATPIPRTLNMAMSGLRDISIIATPPPNRHAIKTFISEWDDALIKKRYSGKSSAAGRFISCTTRSKPWRKRHATWKNWYLLHAFVLPTARCRSGSGTYHAGFLPSAFQRPGLHRHHRKRYRYSDREHHHHPPRRFAGARPVAPDQGRVGRSHHRAYAYLLVPPKSLMTADAVKRLEAIEATGELGSGFMLSSHDLEIRGAGELLGEEQSGQIQEIGLSLIPNCWSGPWQRSSRANLWISICSPTKQVRDRPPMPCPHSRHLPA